VMTGLPPSMATHILWISSRPFCPDRIRAMVDSYWGELTALSPWGGGGVGGLLAWMRGKDELCPLPGYRGVG
jgi:hypothetical protein